MSYQSSNIIRQSTDDFLLTQKDKINWSYIVSKVLLTINEAILSQDEMTIQKSIDTLASIIPSQLKDPEWDKALEDAEVKRTRKKYYCGIPLQGTEKEVVRYDPFLQLQACIDLLQRRGMISKTRWKEITDGTRFNKEDIKEEDFIGDIKFD